MLAPRLLIALGGAAAAAAFWWFNLLAVVYVGNTACGGDASPAPVSGSARSLYCEFVVEHADERVAFLAALFVSGPVAIVIGGVIWATVIGASRPIIVSLFVACMWLLTYVLLAALLPAT